MKLKKLSALLLPSTILYPFGITHDSFPFQQLVLQRLQT